MGAELRFGKLAAGVVRAARSGKDGGSLMSETERNHDVGRRPSAASPSSNAVRALLRLWLGVPDMRPVHPHIRSGGIEAVPGRTPSYDWTKLTKNRN